MKKKLFGNNIEPSCSYCENSVCADGTLFCVKNRSVTDGKCSKFIYNPIMRIPMRAAKLKKYKQEDFLL